MIIRCCVECISVLQRPAASEDQAKVTEKCLRSLGVTRSPTAYRNLVFSLGLEVEERIESYDIVDAGEGYTCPQGDVVQRFLREKLIFIEELCFFQNAEQFSMLTFPFRNYCIDRFEFPC